MAVQRSQIVISTLVSLFFLMRFRRSLVLLSIGAVFLTLTSNPVTATIVIPPEFEEMAAKSDFVVRGRVDRMTSELVAKDDSRKIYTRVKVEVLEIIAGTPPEDLVLVCLGGRVGDEELIVDGAPVFRVGEESIFFVRRNGRALSPLYAMSYGHYPIRTDSATKRRYVARQNEVPLESVAEVAQPLLEGPAAHAESVRRVKANALSPTDFAEKIKAVVSRRNTTIDANH